MSTDLKDGVLLMALIELLTGFRLHVDGSIERLEPGVYKPSPLLNATPRSRSERKDNVNLCLKFWRQWLKRIRSRQRLPNMGVLRSVALCSYCWLCFALLCPQSLASASFCCYCCCCVDSLTRLGAVVNEQRQQ